MTIKVKDVVPTVAVPADPAVVEIVKASRAEDGSLVLDEKGKIDAVKPLITPENSPLTDVEIAKSTAPAVRAIPGTPPVLIPALPAAPVEPIVWNLKLIVPPKTAGLEDGVEVLAFNAKVKEFCERVWSGNGLVGDTCLLTVTEDSLGAKPVPVIPPVEE